MKETSPCSKRRSRKRRMTRRADSATLTCTRYSCRHDPRLAGTCRRAGSRISIRLAWQDFEDEEIDEDEAFNADVEEL
jgi:hypothetical protein